MVHIYYPQKMLPTSRGRASSVKFWALIPLAHGDNERSDSCDVLHVGFGLSCNFDDSQLELPVLALSAYSESAAAVNICSRLRPA